MPLSDTGSSRALEEAILSIVQRRVNNTPRVDLSDLWIDKDEIVSEIRKAKGWSYHRAYRAAQRGAMTSSREGRLLVQSGRYFLRSIPREIKFEIPLEKWLWLTGEDQKLLADREPKVETAFDLFKFIGAILRPDVAARSAYMERVRTTPSHMLSETDRRVLEIEETIDKIMHERPRERRAELQGPQEPEVSPAPGESPHIREARRTPSLPQSGREPPRRKPASAGASRVRQKAPAS